MEELLTESAHRIEKDSMGEMRIPSRMLYGAQTERARQNFPISGLRLSRQLIRALGLIKAAGARVNGRLELLDATRAEAIAKAGGIREAVAAGSVEERADLTLSEALVLGLLRQGVRTFVSVLGHGSTEVGEVLRVYEEAGLGPGDVDECALGSDDCDINATCTNIDPGYRCACNEGYAGDGTACEVVMGIHRGGGGRFAGGRVDQERQAELLGPGFAFGVTHGVPQVLHVVHVHSDHVP